MAEFEIVAETGDYFADFAPYVPAIDSAGQVCFQAALRDGGQGVFLGASPLVLTAEGVYREIISHPDRDDSGRVCFYGLTDEGPVLGLGSSFIPGVAVGPLGPTMNASGVVGVRGESGIYIYSGTEFILVAQIGDRFLGFQGLPVVNDLGTVCFRADLGSGRSGIYVWDGGEIRTVVETEGELGRFPCLDDRGRVGFVRPEGVFVWEDGVCERVYSSDISLRGMLLYDSGFIYFGTPMNAALGIYRGDTRLLGLGDLMLGSAVVDLALNPVSINSAGDFAVRVKLQDGRQMILRFGI